MATAEQKELWGGETRKAIANFPVSGEPVPAPVIHWLGRIKAAAARVNSELGLLDADLSERIAAGGYAAQVRLGTERVRASLGRVGQIPLGGTATGTGLNTHEEFAERVRARLT